MKHLGDITKISGYNVPVVDIVVGGSPCQDLSIAGKREGLAGQRSGLFMEQIRIVKEMRENDKRNRGAVEHIRYIRPRYMVWENVPGAFSSNKGEDFRAVLEETARIVQEDAVIPRFEGGKWRPAGVILGDGWSIAWRVHDAQFWGVPQRRKRICLVADFGGHSASEILFEREGLQGNFTEGRTERQEIARDTRDGTEKTSRAISFQERAGKPGGGKGILIQVERTGALSTLNNQSVCVASKASHFTSGHMGNISDTLLATDYKDPQVVAYGLDRASYNSGINAQFGFSIGKEKIATQTARGPGAVCYNYVVRRLIPMECERLQGFPDGWTDIGDWIDSKGKKHKGDSDAPRYKALGNSIALPFWEWMAKKMCSYLENPTMASLFDGIGGFPLVYSRVGCKPVWASEIEEFPIAVTKKMFGEE